MKTRNIIIVLAIFYAIVIPVSIIFLIPIEEEEKTHELEIIMDKTVYKKGDIVEYNEDDFIIQNNTGWDREIFSDYKLFELINYDGTPLFIIPYQLDVNIVTAKFMGGQFTSAALYFTFDTPTKWSGPL